MSKGTPLRAVRVDAELWEKAKAKAKDRGDNLSHILRQALEKYVNEGTKDDQ